MTTHVYCNSLETNMYCGFNSWVGTTCVACHWKPHRHRLPGGNGSPVPLKIIKCIQENIMSMRQMKTSATIIMIIHDHH